LKFIPNWVWFFFLTHKISVENVVDNVEPVKKKRKKRFSESVDQEVSVKSEPSPCEVTVQPECELGRASSAESPRKRKKNKENRDVQDKILYVSMM
jgi:hypothetical protein